MKTTMFCLALGLASLTFAQTPAPATAKSAPASVKSTKKHAKKASKKSVKANSAASVQTPAKK